MKMHLQQGSNDISSDQPSDGLKEYPFAVGSPVPQLAQAVLCSYYGSKIITKNCRPLPRPAESWPRAAMTERMLKRQKKLLEKLDSSPA